jgi:hypothetical protein
MELSKSQSGQEASIELHSRSNPFNYSSRYA